MEIAVVGATAAVTVSDGAVESAAVAITALAPTIRLVPEAAEALAGSDGGSEAVPQRGERGRSRRRADLGRPWISRLPAGHGRGADRPRHPGRAGAGARRSRPSAGEPGGSRSGSGVVKVAASLTVNGVAYPVEVTPGTSLLAAVRNEIGLTGAKEGCDDSECGACMMLLDGEPVNSCSYLALQAEGREVTTIEGLADGEGLAPLQRAFLEHGGVQCGFCTPGMLISAEALLRANPQPSEEDVRIALSGNLCRCTGYDGIVKAVLAVAETPETRPRRELRGGLSGRRSAWAEHA